LTRAGCSSNLELLTSIPFGINDGSIAHLRLAQDAYRFFKRACNDADEESARIARQWLDELPQVAPWLALESPTDEPARVQLLHSYGGSLWERLTSALGGAAPRKALVISPFYDADGEMVDRLHRRWPRCKIELLLQQRTTTLPISTLRTLQKFVSLSEIRNSTRRLHAKLLAWESDNGSGCLVGSANFTTAAFDAKNVETCLLVSHAGKLVEALFDTQLAKRPLALADFEPGTEQEPGAEESPPPHLYVASALLGESGDLRISYRHDLASIPLSLHLALRVVGEPRPRALFPLPNRHSGIATVTPQRAVLENAHGTILASLVAEVGDVRHEGPPVWVIQEQRLTYEPSGQDPSGRQSRIEESGEGLIEFLEELGKRDGVSAMIDYLRHLNIRFDDGGGAAYQARRFRLRIHDPFHPDVAPDWLLHADKETDDLAAAIFDFVDRHYKQRLCKHARRGNVNGVENFLDILTALVRVLYVYYVRDVVHRDQLIGRLCRYLEIATRGLDVSGESADGYLLSLHENLRNSRYLREVSEKTNLLGHLRAILLIAQRVRFRLGERTSWGVSRRFTDCLHDQSHGLRGTIREVHLNEPSATNIMKALGEYSMFLPAELEEFQQALL
jgi:hypothetical protein